MIESALAASPDLRSAQAKLREARVRRALAGAGAFPSVSASVTRSRAKSSELYSADFDASWEPDVFGAVRWGVEAAQADLEASQASLHDTQVSLVAEIAIGCLQT